MCSSVGDRFSAEPQGGWTPGRAASSAVVVEDKLNEVNDRDGSQEATVGQPPSVLTVKIIS